MTAWSFARVRARALVVLASIVLLVGGAGFVAGYLATKSGTLSAAKAYVLDAVSAADLEPPIERRFIVSAYHRLELRRLRLGRAWMLEEVGGNILFASRWGRFGYVDPVGRVSGIDAEVPMNLDALLASPFARDDLFEPSRFRVTDLLTMANGGAYDLYVAHQQFDVADCMRLVVSRTRLRAGRRGVVFSGAWETVFRTRDCVRPKSAGEYFAGEESGGRLAQLDADRLALSIGDFQFDGVYSDTAVAMDPDSDLGKIISISISTGETELIASGLRNPQGLLALPDGLWETEHGPRGGDDLNLIRAGANYGWPLVTYGTRYGSGPARWRPDVAIGDHEGYEQPAFVFSQAIAISNLVAADAREFPNWSGDLLIGSLRHSLYRVRLRDGRVLFTEQIPLDVRMRDIIVLGDGRLAMSDDGGDVFILSNTDIPREEPGVLTGLEWLWRPELVEVRGPRGARRGVASFGMYCSSCHSLNGEVEAGPPLNGIVGREIGAFPEYAYSEALASSADRWTTGRLRQYITESRRCDAGHDDALPRCRSSGD